MHFYTYSLFCIVSAFVVRDDTTHVGKVTQDSVAKVKQSNHEAVQHGSRESPKDADVDNPTPEELARNREKLDKLDERLRRENPVNSGFIEGGEGEGTPPPISYIAMAVMLLLHGFFLDVIEFCNLLYNSISYMRSIGHQDLL